MALVSSASAWVRKMGQLPVLGLSSAIFVGGQGEALLRRRRSSTIESKEDEISRLSGRVVRHVSQRQQAELVRLVYGREDALAVLEIIETRQCL